MSGLDGVTRSLLERYLAYLATDSRSLHSRSRDIGSLSAFLDAIRRHECDPTLPTNAVFYLDDHPKPDKRLPRGLAEHIMAQVEQPANLNRWNLPERRLLTVILMRCGLRIDDALPHRGLPARPRPPVAEAPAHRGPPSSTRTPCAGAELAGASLQRPPRRAALLGHDARVGSTLTGRWSAADEPRWQHRRPNSSILSAYPAPYVQIGPGLSGLFTGVPAAPRPIHLVQLSVLVEVKDVVGLLLLLGVGRQWRRRIDRRWSA